MFVAIAPHFLNGNGFALDQTPVISGIDTLMNPWTGGLTAPQWSPIDFDGDGDEDLFLLTVTALAYLRLNVTGTNGHFDLIGLKDYFVKARMVST